MTHESIDSVLMVRIPPKKKDYRRYSKRIKIMLRTTIPQNDSPDPYLQGLCCCVWLVPLRNYDDMVGTACLVRAARNLGGNLLWLVFLTRELVWN